MKNLKQLVCGIQQTGSVGDLSASEAVDIRPGIYKRPLQPWPLVLLDMKTLVSNK